MLPEQLKWLIGGGAGGATLIFLGKAAIALFKYIRDLKDDKSKSSSSNNININVDHADHTGQLPISADARYQQTLYLLLQQAKIMKAIHYLKSNILGEQMDTFKKTMKPIRLRYTEIICDLLEEAGIENIYFGTYFTNAENFIELCGKYVESTFRQMCKENHFSKKSSAEFRDLVDTNVIIIDGLVNEMMMKRYPQKQLLKNGDRFDDIRDEMKESMEDCFKKCRDIAIEKESRVQEMVTEFQDEIFRVTGNKYVLDM